MAGSGIVGEVERKTKAILEFAQNPKNNVILFIDEIHTLVGAGGAEGAIDASNIFKPALARGKIRCIGATTTDEYKKFIEKDSALDRRFQKVIIEEPTKENLKDILMNLKEIYESYHGVVINEDIIDLNIGGTELLSTTKRTLTKYKNSALGIMFSGKIEIGRASCRERV